MTFIVPELLLYVGDIISSLGWLFCDHCTRVESRVYKNREHFEVNLILSWGINKDALELFRVRTMLHESCNMMVINGFNDL